jgi:DNA-binding XRE family transcriptional regulator
MKSNLKEFRIEGGWTQRELSKTAGISDSHLSLLETGKRLPSLELAFLLASILDRFVDDIWSL